MMKFPSVVPLSWKIGAALALVGALVAIDAHRMHKADKAGYDRAITELDARDLGAIVRRTVDNTALAVKQDASNFTITKVKNEELAPVRARIVADRVRVGPAICGGSAATAKTEDAAGSNGTDTGSRLVPQRTEEDFRALELTVEEALATGRACQAFGRENGFYP